MKLSQYGAITLVVSGGLRVGSRRGVSYSLRHAPEKRSNNSGSFDDRQPAVGSAQRVLSLNRLRLGDRAPREREQNVRAPRFAVERRRWG